MFLFDFFERNVLILPETFNSVLAIGVARLCMLSFRSRRLIHFLILQLFYH